MHIKFNDFDKKIEHEALTKASFGIPNRFWVQLSIVLHVSVLRANKEGFAHVWKSVDPNGGS